MTAAAGDVLLWRANLIHWGSACGESNPTPRKSIAMAFMRPDGTDSGRFSRGTLQSGLSLTRRVRVIARALLTYEHWHPDFSGLAKGVVDSSLRSMAYSEVTTDWT